MLFLSSWTCVVASLTPRLGNSLHGSTQSPRCCRLAPITRLSTQQGDLTALLIWVAILVFKLGLITPSHKMHLSSICPRMPRAILLTQHSTTRPCKQQSHVRSLAGPSRSLCSLVFHERVRVSLQHIHIH